MKKVKSVISFLLAFLTAVSAASCSGSNTSSVPGTDAPQSVNETSAAAEDPASDDPASDDGDPDDDGTSDEETASDDNAAEDPASDDGNPDDDGTSDEETAPDDNAAEDEDTISGTEIPVNTSDSSAAAQEQTDASDAGDTSSAGDTTAASDETADTTDTTAPAAEENDNDETPAQTTSGDSAAPASSGSVTDAPDASPDITASTSSSPAAAPRTAGSARSTVPSSKAAASSPPKISEVSSPGKNVFKSDTATLDWSNCSSGYISVDYKGKTRLKMLLKKDGSQFDYDIYPAKGAQYFTLAQGSGTYNAEVYEMLSNGKFIKLIGDTFTAKISDPIKMFTYKNQYVNFGANSKCVAKASEVCAGCSTDIEKIAAVFGFVTDNITYDKALAASVTSGYIPDPDSVLARKKGICFDYASLTAAMLRSQGVPTRLVIGYASPNIYHAWNEVYTSEKGWITAEIVLEGKGFRRIDATFYASAANKQTFADYISKQGNYSDVYVY